MLGVPSVKCIKLRHAESVCLLRYDLRAFKDIKFAVCGVEFTLSNLTVKKSLFKIYLIKFHIFKAPVLPLKFDAATAKFKI